MATNSTLALQALFDISYGQKEYESKEYLDGEVGTIPLISSKGVDNGVYGTYLINAKYQAPIITVPRTGTIGHAFVQLEDCAVDNNCLVLQPRRKLTTEELFQVAFQIRLNKWKYKYGRQITPHRLGAQKIKLATTSIKHEKLMSSLLPKVTRKSRITPNNNLQLISITELCSLERKYSLYLNQLDMTAAKVPYVTTTEKDNGVALFCNEDPVFKGKALTVSLDGSCGETFFQADDFIAGEKTAVIRLLGNYNPYLLLYVGYQIKKASWRFHYGRKLSMARLQKFQLPIPFKNGNIDTDYIEAIIKSSYGFDKLEAYL